MERQRTYLVLVLILVSPFAALTPLTSPSWPGSSNVTSAATTVSYTSTTMTTDFASSNGSVLVQQAVAFPPRVIGFIAPKGKCAQFSLPVTVTSNTTLNVQMSSNNPANFYLLPNYAPQPSSSCSIVGNAIVTAINFTKFLLHWTAPAGGTFYFMFTGPTTVIMLTNQGSVKPVIKAGTVTVATSTETSRQLYSVTLTATYTSSAKPSVYMQLAAQYAPLVGIIIVLLFAGLILLRINRDATSGELPPPEPPAERILIITRRTSAPGLGKELPGKA